MKKIKGIIFDCDGVLFDSKDVNIIFYNEVRAYFDLGPMSDEQIDFVHMHSVGESFRHILPAGFESELPKIRDRLNYAKLLPYMRMEDGLVQLLQFIAQRKLPMAINTNRTTTMNLLLSTFGLEQFFHPVVTADDVSRPKPHPESLFKILHYWSVLPEQVVFIGDSVVDEEAAMRADIPFWAYKNQELSSRMFIPSFWALREFLSRNLS
ncbi:MAG: HAD family hydrolase [Desulfonatronovibrio sp. MSAO_Bac4]|nr:MAG: HAD family hydrolase [Desulfonatronovibrio sp. MSAO_Bac4]